jgi:hypothetical protein
MYVESMALLLEPAIKKKPSIVKVRTSLHTETRVVPCSGMLIEESSMVGDSSVLV